MADYNMNPSEIEMERRRKKAARKQAKRGRDGKTVKTTAQLNEEQERQQSNQENNIAKHLLAKEFAVPEDVSVAEYEERDPELWQDLKGGKSVHCVKQDGLYRARVMWFNEIDKKHTFSGKHQQARMLYAMLQATKDKKLGITDLEKAFCSACLERCAVDKHWTKSMVVPFQAREKFIKLWVESDEDLHIFSKSKGRLYKDMVKALRAALPEIDEHHNPPPGPEQHYTDTRLVSPFTTMIGPVTDRFHSKSGAAFDFNSPPTTNKPFWEQADRQKPLSEAKSLFMASPQIEYEPDSDESEDNGDDDETMVDNLPEAARTCDDILDEYRELLAEGDISLEKHRERVKKLAQLTRAVAVGDDYEEVLRTMGTVNV